MIDNAPSRTRRLNWIWILIAVTVAALGLYLAYAETAALETRAQLRTELERKDALEAPESTIAAAKAYLTTLVANPNEGQVRWALSRYEIALRRYVALRAGRDDADLEQFLAEYRDIRTAALEAFTKGTGQ